MEKIIPIRCILLHIWEEQVLKIHAVAHDPANDKEPSPDVQPTASTTIAYVGNDSHGLAKETHGEWLTVSRRKRNVPKKDLGGSNQNMLDGLQNLIDHSNQELAMQKDGGRKPAEKVSTKTNAKGKHRRQESSISNAKVIPSQPPKPLTNPPPGFSFVTGNKDPGPASQGSVLKASEAQTRNVPHKNGQPIRTTNRSNEMAMDSSSIPPTIKCNPQMTVDPIKDVS